MMVHAPVVALPPNTAPVNGMAAGIADWHVLIGPPTVTVGNAFTVTNWLTELEQPPLFIVYVMIDVPGDTPVTNPPGPPTPPAVTVATPVLALDQDPKLVASANCEVDPAQTLAVPVIAANEGGVLTVIVRNALKAGDPLDTNFKITVPE